jgi:pilus assembly protein Flp/PilA
MLTNWIWRLLARFRSEDGQALAEYGLIMALIAVVCIPALTRSGGGKRQLGDMPPQCRSPDEGPDVMRVPRGPDWATAAPMACTAERVADGPRGLVSVLRN